MGGNLAGELFGLDAVEEEDPLLLPGEGMLLRILLLHAQPVESESGLRKTSDREQIRPNPSKPTTDRVFNFFYWEGKMCFRKYQPS